MTSGPIDRARTITTWVARAANAPTSPSGELFATSTDLDGEQTRFVVHGWTPRVLPNGAVVCPDVGDTLFVTYDASGRAVCLGWELAA